MSGLKLSSSSLRRTYAGVIVIRVSLHGCPANGCKYLGLGVALVQCLGPARGGGWGVHCAL